MNTLVQTKLSDFADVFSGYAFKSTEFKKMGVKVVKISNIRIGKINFDESKTQYVDKTYLKTLGSKFIVKNGDVLISLTGSHLTQPNSVVGRVAKYNYNQKSLLNQRAGKIIIKDEKLCDLSFLYYLLYTQTLRTTIALLAHGAANQANVSPTDIKKLKVFLPPVDAQKKIAATLSAYDDLIENNNRRITILEKIAEEIYKEWFVRMRFPGHEKTKFVKGIPGEWEVVGLDKIVNLTMGQSPKSKFYNTYGEGLPFNQGVGTYGVRFPKRILYCSVKGRIANKGEILFSVRAPVGRLNIADCKMIIGRGLAAISHKDKFNSYLFYLLKSYFSAEDIIGNGAIFNSVGKDELKKFKILLSEINLIKLFEKKVSFFDKKIALLLKKNINLKQTRDRLLTRLISGKLSVENLNIKFPKSMREKSDA